MAQWVRVGKLLSLWCKQEELSLIAITHVKSWPWLYCVLETGEFWELTGQSM